MVMLGLQSADESDQRSMVLDSRSQVTSEHFLKRIATPLIPDGLHRFI